jgi:hypothetical protein
MRSNCSASLRFQIEQCLEDGINFQVPRTLLTAPPSESRVPAAIRSPIRPSADGFSLQDGRKMEVVRRSARQEQLATSLWLHRSGRSANVTVVTAGKLGACGHQDQENRRQKSGVANTIGLCILLTREMVAAVAGSTRYRGVC